MSPKMMKIAVIALSSVLMVAESSADEVLDLDKLTTLTAIYDLILDQKYDEARAQLRPLVDKGNGEAEYILAEMTEKGAGVSPDPGGAMILYAQSARDGYPFAQKKMGLFYFKIGQYSRALATLQPLSREGFRGEVAMALSDMYRHGLGTPIDTAKADCWERKAIEPVAVSIKSGC